MTGAADNDFLASTMHGLLDVAGDVGAALQEGRAVVALESTIIAHGMPWPQNAETALAVEADVRALGAVPATVAVLDGRLRAGLAREEIERLAHDGHAGPPRARCREPRPESTTQE